MEQVFAMLDCGLPPRTVALVSLVGLGLWASLLVLFIGIARMAGTMVSNKKLTDFPGGVQHGGDMYWRLNRAHANMCENLGMFCAIIFSGVLLDCVTVEFAQLCQVIVMARVMQSLVHISSGCSAAIFIRFGFFGMQMMSVTYLGLSILSSVGVISL